MSSMSWAIQAGTGWTMEHNILWSLSHLVTDNFDLTETTATYTWLRRKQLLAFYLQLQTVVIPNAPNLSISILIRELKPGIPFYCVCVITGVSLKDGSTRYSWILLGRTEYTSVIHNCSTSQAWLLFVLSRGGCDIGLDFDLALKSQVYIVLKFHKVSLGGREESCWVSTALRGLSSLLALVLHLAIGIYTSFHLRREQSWSISNGRHVGLWLRIWYERVAPGLKWSPSKWKRIVEISWSQ